MIPIMMIQDANTVAGLAGNTIIEFTGGDWLFLGLIVFFMIAIMLLFANVRSGATIVIGVAFSYLLTVFSPEFSFIFWLAVIVGIFIMVKGARQQNQ